MTSKNAGSAPVDAGNTAKREAMFDARPHENTRAQSAQLSTVVKTGLDETDGTAAPTAAELDEAAVLHLTADRQPVLLNKGSKTPIKSKWQTIEYKSFDDWRAERRDGCNIGLRLGPASGGLVDIDIDDARIKQAFDEAARNAGVLLDTTAFGHHGRITHLMYRCSKLPVGAASLALKDEAGKTVIELRCQPNQMTMVPPSLWGAKNKSADPRQPERLQHVDNDWSKLREVDFAVLEKAVRVAHAAVCPTCEQTEGESKPNKKRKTNLPPPSLVLLQDVMSHISNAQMGYADWTKIGLALKSCCGGDKPVSDAQGLELWVNFSENWPKNPNDEAATRKKWKELRPSGKAGFGTLVHHATNKGWVPIDDEIIRFNDSHAVLPIGGKTRVVRIGEPAGFPSILGIAMVQTSNDFINLQNKYRQPHTNKPLGTYWWNSPRRRQYDDGAEFMPQRDGDTATKLNLWRGFGVKPAAPTGKSGAAGCQLFLDFALEVICSGNAGDFEYLMNREAFIMQRRRRSEIALAMHSEEEGVGKGFYERHLGRLLGSHYMQISNPEHLIGKFNPHLELLLRLTADEALFVGDPRHRNALFGLITESRLTIEPKGCGVYNPPNFLNISMTSNAAHFIPAGGTARRFFVLTVSPCHMQDREYFSRIEDQMINDGGSEALLHHLLYERELRDFDVVAVPKTAALAEQVAYGRRGVDGLVEKVCHEAAVPCAHPYWLGFTITTGLLGEVDNFHDYVKRDRELQRLGGLRVITQLRRDWGCKSERRRESNSDQRTSGFYWPLLSELREQFVRRFGPQDWMRADVSDWPAGVPINPLTGVPKY